VIRRLLGFGWPTALVAGACVGLAASNWIRPTPGVCAVAVLGAAIAAAFCGGYRRLALAAVVMALAGAWWGAMRLDALEQSVLAARIGERAGALVAITGPVRRGLYSLRMPAEVRRFGGERIHETVLLELPRSRAPPQGALLELQARPVAPRGPETGFDERGWLARRGVHIVLRGREPRVVGRRGGIGGVADRLHRHVASALASGASGERLALLDGVVLGDDDGLDADLKADFKAAGLYHLLAVSGQNVAFIVWGVLGLAWTLGVPRAGAHAGVLVAIGAYALAVGWQPSVVRAAVAGALASLAWLASRPRDRWHFLTLGALILLAWNPASVFDPGFQLSFAAVVAIFVWVPWRDRKLALLPLPFQLPKLLRGTIAVSIACGTVTSPILWLDFRQVPLWTVVANALAEPAVGPLLGLGLLAALVAPVLPSAAAALAWLASWAAAWIAFSARLVAGLPWAQTSSALVLVLVGAGGVAAVVVSRLPRWRRRGAVTALAALTLVVAAAWWARSVPPAWTPPADGGLRVTFLDVGQGDAELLEVPQGAVLVDTGPPEANVGRQLRRLGLRSLSAVVLTHPHRDHVGGMPSVVSRLHVAELLDPRQPGGGTDERAAIASARRAGVPVIAAREGETLRIGSLVLRVLWPDGAGLQGEDPHRHAVVLLASFGATDVLLTADAESDVTSALRLPPVEILKVAHHGSADPGLPDLLRRLRPRVAVIEVGKHNDYGHPRPQTLAALAASPELRVYRTDENGRIVVESDGETFSVRVERGVGSVP
jgi:competence protein ComEC